MQVVKGYSREGGRVQIMMGFINLCLNGDEEPLKCWW